uniref:Uncharacterized protein n=1 Tax=Rhizophora mucronata TaxID=61149 RepID=A0A2P2NT75_RHIMU
MNFTATLKLFLVLSSFDQN